MVSVGICLFYLNFQFFLHVTFYYPLNIVLMPVGAAVLSLSHSLYIIPYIMLVFFLSLSLFLSLWIISLSVHH